MTQTLTSPAQRPQLHQTQQPASYPKRRPISNFSRDGRESYPGRRHMDPRASKSSYTPRNSKKTARPPASDDDNKSPKHSLSSETSREIADIFSSVTNMSDISSIESRKNFKNLQTDDVDYKPPVAELRSIDDKLRDFQFAEVDPSSPEEARLACVDFSVVAFAIAKNETERICKKIDDAVSDGRGDLGIWRICENMIFPMLNQAGLNEAQPIGPTVTSSTGVPKGDTAKDFSHCLDKPDNTQFKPIDIHPDVPIAIVVRRVYPATLLHALRLLQDKFPMSPITTRLFESIRAHGRASLIMGSSKELFHELIAFRWRVYNDLPFIVTLLKQMEENGIDFDKRTLELVERIRQRGMREISKARQPDGVSRGGNIVSRARRANGGTHNNATWWDTPVIRKAYQELTNWAKGMDAQIKDVKMLEEKAEEVWNIKHPPSVFRN
ncbi:hypothetical protein FQN49_000953 [Arthroderma sp. PD_2]|nr:hypothetical protein FQN49_000953 [Arthroderma sp. PD_2]